MLRIEIPVCMIRTVGFLQVERGFDLLSSIESTVQSPYRYSGYRVLEYGVCSIHLFCVRTLLHAGVSGHEFQLEITAQSSSRIFLELDWAVDRKLD